MFPFVSIANYEFDLDTESFQEQENPLYINVNQIKWFQQSVYDPEYVLYTVTTDEEICVFKGTVDDFMMTIYE